MSDFPIKFDPELPDNWSTRYDLIEKMLLQVEKDFALQGIPLSLKSNSEKYADLVALLAENMESLDIIHGGKLAGLLYQIDLPEKQLRQEMPTIQAAHVYQVLADKILKRCFQKVFLRESFR